MSDEYWSDRLVALGACPDAVDWSGTQPDLATAWATCDRGDWLLWLAGRVLPDDAHIPERRSPERVRLVLAALDCAHLAWPCAREEGRAVVSACVDATRRWAEGTATQKDVRVARRKAINASYAPAYAAAGVAVMTRHQCKEHHVAVFNEDLLGQGVIKFGQNSYRGDHFERWLRNEIAACYLPDHDPRDRVE